MKYLVALAIYVSTAVMAEDKVINYVVIQNQSQPFQIEKAGKNHTGIVTELINEMFEGSGYEVKVHTFPFNRMKSMLTSGKLRNWITYGSPGWGGPQAANLSSSPIYHVEHKLLTTKDFEKEVNKVDDLFGKTAILLHGFDYPGLEPYLEADSVKEIRVKDYAAAFKVLDRLDEKAGFVEMSLRINYNLKKQGRDPQNYKLKDFSSVISDYDIFLAYAPDIDPNIQAFANQQLSRKISSGKLEKIVNKYQ